MGQATKTDINQGHTLVMMSCIYYVSQLPNAEAFRVKCRESLKVISRVEGSLLW